MVSQLFDIPNITSLGLMIACVVSNEILRAEYDQHEKNGVDSEYFTGDAGAIFKEER